MTIFQTEKAHDVFDQTCVSTSEIRARDAAEIACLSGSWMVNASVATDHEKLASCLPPNNVRVAIACGEIESKRGLKTYNERVDIDHNMRARPWTANAVNRRRDEREIKDRNGSW